MCVCATYIKRNGPCTVRSAPVCGPFESRLTSVLLKRSGVKRTVHGKFFLPYTVFCHQLGGKFGSERYIRHHVVRYVTKHRLIIDKHVYDPPFRSRAVSH